MQEAILAVRFVFLDWAVTHHLLNRDSRGSLCELSVVVPCHNESGNLETLHRRVVDVCRRRRILIIDALVSWLFFSTVTGWTSLIAVVAAIGSVQLFVLGIFGEYLGRLAMQSQGRPLFIIEEIRGVAPLPDRAS
jgi:hypothetical protein